MAMLWGSEDIKNTLPLDLLARFDEIRSDPFSDPTTSLPFYDGKTGELVVRIPGGIAMRVSREKLRKFLSSDVDIQVVQCHGAVDCITLADWDTVWESIDQN
jgi:hypothetical protein